MLSEKRQSGRGSGENVDWRVSDVEALKKNFKKWRKIALQATPYGIGLVILYWVIPVHLPFPWGVIVFLLGIAPGVGFYLSHSLKIVQLKEVGIVTRMGNFVREAYTGPTLIKSPFEKIGFVSTRQVQYDPMTESVFTKEQVLEDGKLKEKLSPAEIDIAFVGEATDPFLFYTAAQDPIGSTPVIVQGKLRIACGEKSFKEINNDKVAFAKAIENAANEELKDWGYKISKTQIQRFSMPQDLVDAEKASIISSKRQEAALIDAQTRAKIMAILDKKDPDMRRRGLQALEAFKGSINIFGGSVEEILQKITGSTKR